MKILQIKIKSLPGCELIADVDKLYKQSVALVYKRKKLNAATARTIALAVHLNVDDYILDLLQES